MLIDQIRLGSTYLLIYQIRLDFYRFEVFKVSHYQTMFFRCNARALLLVIKRLKKKEAGSICRSLKKNILIDDLESPVHFDNATEVVALMPMGCSPREMKQAWPTKDLD